MARKRSLKDAAADQLVEKNKTVPKPAVAPAEVPAAEPIAVKPARAKPIEESAIKPLAPAETSQAAEDGKKSCPSSLWGAILVAIGFAAGFFFGIGQAIGAANMAYLLIGFAGGIISGRCLMVSLKAQSRLNA
jgi:hypothetical protein